MRILIATATAAEVTPVTAALEPRSRTSGPIAHYSRGGHDVDVLVTGVGMVATAVHASRALAGGGYDVALNVGVCGSFRRDLPPGTVVHVIDDRFPEVGAEDDDRFLTLQELGLPGDNEFPFASGQLRNERPPANAALARLRCVSGITVNTVHGSDASIARVVARVDPDVESMEGAAFMYACLVQGTAFAQVRAVSNVVERRNRGAWKLGDAIRALGDATLGIIDHA